MLTYCLDPAKHHKKASFDQCVAEAFSHPDSFIEYEKVMRTHSDGGVSIDMVIYIPPHVRAMYNADFNQKKEILNEDS